MKRDSESILSYIRNEVKYMYNMNDIFGECKECVAKDDCPAAAMPGSVMCMVKRMQCGKTHGEELRENRRRCPHCGNFID